MSPKNKFTGRDRTKSIAKRLNGVLARRKFLKTVLTDIIVVLLVLLTWCLTVESGYNSNPDTPRRFTNVFECVIDNTVALLNGNDRILIKQVDSTGWVERSQNTTRLPFSGVYYVFSTNDEVITGEASHTIIADTNHFTYFDHEVAVDASVILTVVIFSFIAILILQTLGFIISCFTGRRLIRKHLRPIDEIAMAAESLSAEATANTTNRESIAHAIDAIDAIDDSCSKIEMKESELGGLEAAINNMLRRLDEEKRKQLRFVDDASHELRTPIAVIQGYANMLDRWGKNDPQVMEEAVSAIKSESDHMTAMLDQLLFLARGEMDRMVMNKEELDICKIIEDIFDESHMLDADHEYENLTPPSEEGGEQTPLMFTGDAAMIKQAIRVLRDNAVKYTPDGGRISFKAYLRGSSSTAGDVAKSICIEISDTGVGISPDELSHIFDRFYRGSNARSTSSSGSGLGLSIAKWIVEAHGGRIEAVSGKGFGTKMSIILPCSAK